MKPQQIRDMSPDQLDDELVKLKKEQFNLRFQRATGQLENTSRVRQVRRDIARIQTIAVQKSAGQKSAGGEATGAKPAPKPAAAKKTAAKKAAPKKTGTAKKAEA